MTEEAKGKVSAKRRSTKRVAEKRAPETGDRPASDSPAPKRTRARAAAAADAKPRTPAASGTRPAKTTRAKTTKAKAKTVRASKGSKVIRAGEGASPAVDGKGPANLYIIGIGASAGGLEALRPLVSRLPRESGMAYIVAQHVSPQHRSMMVELLSRETTLKVVEATEGARIVANVIYVVPPNTDIFISEGFIRLREPAQASGPKPSVDYFFTSLAKDQGERAVSILLSGTGSDGAHGMQAIKACGGIAIAQDPETAKYDSMPRAAIQIGAVDLVLPVTEIGAQLWAITRNVGLAPKRAQMVRKQRPLEKILSQIRAQLRMDFTNYKEATIVRQLGRRLAALQLDSVESYEDYLADNPGELSILAGSILICVTSFFRDPKAFELLQSALGDLIARKQVGEEIRVWVPGCATGEEAYSIAIVIAEILGDRIHNFRIQIFGTDMNANAIQVARKGAYAEPVLENLDPALVEKYFTREARMFVVDRKIRDLAVFATQDIVQDPPFLRVDLVSCRNLLIYLKPQLQDKLFRVFHYALRPNGLLFLGKSEAVSRQDGLFSDYDRRMRLFRKNAGATSKYMPTTPRLALQVTQRKDDEPRQNPFESGKELLFEAYVPPSMMVSDQGTVLGFYGDLAPFVRTRQGPADLNVFNLILPHFRPEVRAFVHRAAREKQISKGQFHLVKADGEDVACRVLVRPVGPGADGTENIMLTFEQAKTAAMHSDTANLGTDELEEVALSRIGELEHELKATRENLQTVVEELETSNEELQSLNEELQAANEELQASNEELETSNEELQASNEELSTVNDQLIIKTQELVRSFTDLSNIQNATGMVMLVIDGDMNVLLANEKARSFFPRLEIGSGSNTHISALTEAAGMPSLTPVVDNVMATGKSSRIEFGHNDRQYLAVAYQYKDESGKLDRVVLSIDDVTEVHSAQLEARQIAEDMAELIASGNAPMFGTDAEGRINAWNPAIGRVTGYDPDDVQGKFFSELLVDPEQRDMVNGLLGRALLGEPTQPREITLKGRTGDPVDILFSFSTRRDRLGTIVGVFGVGQDVTERNRAVKQLIQASKLANLGEMATGMAHEINQPLHVISLAVGDLTRRIEKGGIDPKFCVEKFGRIKRQVERASKIIDHMRVFGRKAEEGRTRFDPVEAIGEAVNLHHEGARLADVEISLAIPSTLPPVLGHPVLLEQVLVNLIGNAIDSLHEVEGVRTVKLRTSSTRSQVRIIVEDNGPGIPEERIDRIFEPFFTTKEVGKGTGLGLSISYGVITDMGGTISAENLGSGARFTIILPVAESDE